MSDGPTIELWSWPLDVGTEERERLARWLSPDELDRVRRLISGRDRERHVAARGRLREILATRVAAPPAALRFARGGHGKPRLAWPAAGPHFSLSHSRGLAVLALCAGAELGVDVEEVRPLRAGVAERCFSPREVAALLALPPAERLRAFYRCWTRKEAVLKALGDGLARPLADFDVTLAEDDPRLERLRGEPEAPRLWKLVHVVPAAGFVGAVALRTPGTPRLVWPAEA